MTNGDYSLLKATASTQTHRTVHHFGSNIRYFGRRGILQAHVNRLHESQGILHTGARSARLSIPCQEGRGDGAHLGGEVNVTGGVDEVDQELTAVRVLGHLVVGNLLLHHETAVNCSPRAPTLSGALMKRCAEKVRNNRSRKPHTGA
jgi:hypothetical protein